MKSGEGGEFAFRQPESSRQSRLTPNQVGNKDSRGVWTREEMEARGNRKQLVIRLIEERYERRRDIEK